MCPSLVSLPLCFCLAFPPPPTFLNPFRPLRGSPPSPLAPAGAAHPPSLASLPRLPAFVRRPDQAPVAVVGATGGVGRLLTSLLLRSGHRVRTIVRDRARAVRVLGPAGGAGRLEIVQAGLWGGDGGALRRGLADARVAVICLGTTAFPTAAWRAGNTPQRVDVAGVRAVVAALGPAVRRVVLTSSIGTTRPADFPFCLLNLFGVLDAKRLGERAVVDGAAARGYDWLVVRLGRLTGAPFTNVGATRVFAPEGEKVRIEEGDSLLGDLLRRDAAEILFHAAVGHVPLKNMAVSAINEHGHRAEKNQIQKEFARLCYRHNLTAGHNFC